MDLKILLKMMLRTLISTFSYSKGDWMSAVRKTALLTSFVQTVSRIVFAA